MLLSLIALGAVDALNPFSWAALMYLMGLPRPIVHGLVFVVGTFVVYLIGGAALVLGVSELLSSWVSAWPAQVQAGGEVALGLLSLMLAAHLWRSQGLGRDFKPPKDLKLRTTLALALASTASDLPTAVPYFAAAALIASADDSRAVQAAMLALYCLVYVAPLLLLMGARAALGLRAVSALARLQVGIDWLFAKLMPVLLAGGGVWLVQDGWHRWGLA